MAKINKILSKTIILLIQGYRRCLSPFLGQRCRFYPSCSSYTQLALDEHGLFKGLYLGCKRLVRCHPWHPGGYDPIPKNRCLHD